MTDITTQFAPKWVSPPGDTILDQLEELGWTQSELAQRTDYSKKHINKIVQGKAPISEDTAFRFERVLGGSASFWLSREAQYREAVVRKEEMALHRSQVDWLKELPLAHMVKYDWILNHKDKGHQVTECLSFFGVASVSAWRKRYEQSTQAVFKSSPKFQMNAASVAAWLRHGEKQATSLETSSFNKQAFKDALHEIRNLTNETEPHLFIPELTNICAQAGVAVVFSPTPPKCPISGATKWLTPEKALLMLSLRYKSNDHLWFAFFHEAGHILLHGKQMTFFETGMKDISEKEADKFASDLLIPPEAVAHLPRIARTGVAVKAFAKQVGIAPGIVVGRMQHEGYLPPSHLNKLKVQYKWLSS